MAGSLPEATTYRHTYWVVLIVAVALAALTPGHVVAVARCVLTAMRLAGVRWRIVILAVPLAGFGLAALSMVLVLMKSYDRLPHDIKNFRNHAPSIFQLAATAAVVAIFALVASIVAAFRPKRDVAATPAPQTGRSVSCSSTSGCWRSCS